MLSKIKNRETMSKTLWILLNVNGDLLLDRRQTLFFFLVPWSTSLLHSHWLIDRHSLIGPIGHLTLVSSLRLAAVLYVTNTPVTNSIYRLFGLKKRIQSNDSE